MSVDKYPLREILKANIRKARLYKSGVVRDKFNSKIRHYFKVREKVNG